MEKMWKTRQGYEPCLVVSLENIIGDAIVPVNIDRTVHGKFVVFGKLLTPRLLIAVNSQIIAIVSAPKNRLSVLIQELLGYYTAIIGFITGAHKKCLLGRERVCRLSRLSDR